MLKNRPMLKLEETNMALAGSDLQKKISLAAANKEPAWENAGQKPGLEIFRIENFQVVPWPVEAYGAFYDGDSYIVLHTYNHPRNKDKLAWDIHFWLGWYTTADEAGTAAYKTVELDTKLGGAPVQHREVQGLESYMFNQLFPMGIRFMQGGVASGFKHVELEKAKPMPYLFHISGSIRKQDVRSVPVSPASLNEEDCFVLDLGDVVYVFQGKTCSAGERNRASTVANERTTGRGKVIVVNSDDAGDDFWAALGEKTEVPEKAPEEEPSKMFKLSDASGKMSFDLVAEGGEVKRDKLNSDDVFVVDNAHFCFVWVGSGASDAERLHAVPHAQDYLNATGRQLRVCCLAEGYESPQFVAAVSG